MTGWPPYFAAPDGRVHLKHGRAEEVLAAAPDGCVDAVVTDPPYELGFMGEVWDGSRFGESVALWRGVLRVLKPGGHLLAFGGTRTYHRLACAIEDAGFEIRDSLHWIYGSGFPKGSDISKAVDKLAGAQREVVGVRRKLESFGPNEVYGAGPSHGGVQEITSPATDEARQWEGWNTQLKPAHEPIILARRPLAGSTAANVLEYGTGALNVDGCRVGGDGDAPRTPADVTVRGAPGTPSGAGLDLGNAAPRVPGLGRWPTNLLFTHDPDCADPGPCAPGCPVADLDAQGGVRGGGRAPVRRGGMGYGGGSGTVGGSDRRDGPGGASRFFPVFRYQAKAPTAERPRLEDGTVHPTVKPLALMRWLVRLVTPPNGLVLDPFAGTGTTLEAAHLEGFRAVGIEREQAYCDLAVKRLEAMG